MKKSAQVDHPSDLLSAAEVQDLVRRKLALSDQPTAPSQPTVPAVNDSAQDILVSILADKAQATADGDKIVGQ